MHLDFILTYGCFLSAGFVLICTFTPTPRPALAMAPQPSWLEPVLIAAAKPEPFFCERTRRWRDPVSRRFVKTPRLAA